MADPRSTIDDKDWRGLQDRARRANPGGIGDPKADARRQMQSDSYKNRDKN